MEPAGLLSYSSVPAGMMDECFFSVDRLVGDFSVKDLILNRGCSSSRFRDDVDNKPELHRRRSYIPFGYLCNKSDDVVIHASNLRVVD